MCNATNNILKCTILLPSSVPVGKFNLGLISVTTSHPCCIFLYGLILFGIVWYGLVYFGMVWYGMVWYGMVWYGLVRFGRVGLVGNFI